MGIRSLYRTSAAVWIAPLLLFLALSHAVSTVTEPAYRMAASVAATSAVFLVAPVCAACAAADATRWRRNRELIAAAARHRLVIATHTLGPSLGVGTAVLVATAAVVTRGIPVLEAFVAAVAITAAYTGFGFALGTRVRPVVAAPLILVVGYAAMVLPLAMEPLWLRHLNGTWFTCCDLASQLSPRAVGGTITVAIAILVVAITLLVRPSVVRFTAAAGVVAGLGILAATAVKPLGPDPVEPRSGALVCSTSTPRVCVWPEHREALNEVTELATDAARRWHQVGITVPAVFTERPGTAEGAVTMSVVPGRHSATLSSMAAALLPVTPTCAETGPFPGGEAFSYLAAWLAVEAGVPEEALRALWGEDVAGLILEVRRQPLARQQSWVTRNSAALDDCTTPPSLELST